MICDMFFPANGKNRCKLLKSVVNSKAYFEIAFFVSGSGSRALLMGIK